MEEPKESVAKEAGETSLAREASEPAENALRDRVEETKKKAKVISSTRKIFKRRKATLEKQARELGILCGCRIAMFCIEPDGKMEFWPRDKGTVGNIIKTFNSHKLRAKKKNKSGRGKAKVDVDMKVSDDGAEPVENCGLDLSLRLGFADDSCETSNRAGERAAVVSEGFRLRDENRYENLLDLELRLGLGQGTRTLENKESSASMDPEVRRL